jgi:hypothetical protein
VINVDVEEGRQDRSRGPLVAVGVAAVVIAIGLGIVLATRGRETAVAPVDRAVAFWEAVEADDREAALGQVDPAVRDSGEANIFGRSSTLEGNFDWYEATGWQWALDGCIEIEGGVIECTVTARNDWSDAIGLEPIVGVYAVRIGQDGITDFIDKDENFRSQWIPQSFEVFAGWVDTHHPADAAIMFDRDRDLDPEMLELYRINTARFVEAYPTQ